MARAPRGNGANFDTNAVVDDNTQGLAHDMIASLSQANGIDAQIFCEGIGNIGGMGASASLGDANSIGKHKESIGGNSGTQEASDDGGVDGNSGCGSVSTDAGGLVAWAAGEDYEEDSEEKSAKDISIGCCADSDGTTLAGSVGPLKSGD